MHGAEGARAAEATQHQQKIADLKNRIIDLGARVAIADEERAEAATLRAERDRLLERETEYEARIKRDHEEIVELTAEIFTYRELLVLAREALDNYSDVVDGDYGRPLPNKAMKAMMEIASFLEIT